MEHHLDNSTFVSCLMYTQATFKKIPLKFLYFKLGTSGIHRPVGPESVRDRKTLGYPRVSNFGILRPDKGVRGSLDKILETKK